MLDEVEKDIMRKGFERKLEKWTSKEIFQSKGLKSIMIEGHKQTLEDIFELQRISGLTLREMLGEELCDKLVKTIKEKDFE